MFFRKKYKGNSTPDPEENKLSSQSLEIFENLLNETNIEKRRTRRWGLFFKSLGFVYLISLTLFLVDVEFFSNSVSSTEEHTAFIKIDGIIGTAERSNAYNINLNLESAFQERGVKGVVLEINSPGGSPVQSEYIYQAIIKYKNLHPDIPVHAIISDIGTSGAYYIAVAADQIHASPASIIGSIGVIVAGFGFSEFIKKIGIDRRIIFSGNSKAMLDPFLPESSAQRTQIQKILDNTHDLFISRVREGRRGRLIENPDEPLFDGRVWSGEQALNLGLIDSLSYPDEIAEVVIGARKRIYYESEESILDRISKKLGVGLGNAFSRILNTRLEYSSNLVN